MGKIKQAFDDVAPDAKMKKGFLQATKYLNEHLNPGETAIYRAHLSWIPVFVRQIPFMLVGSLVGGIVGGVMGNLLIGLGIALGAWVIGALSQVGQIYKNIATDILLTNQGIHSKKKLFAVEDDQFSRYGVINDARLNYNSIFQRIFQYGDVEVETIGSDADYTYKCLAKPMAFKQAVRAAQQKFGQGAAGGTIPGGTGGYGGYDDGYGYGYDDYDEPPRKRSGVQRGQAPRGTRRPSAPPQGRPRPGQSGASQGSNVNVRNHRAQANSLQQKRPQQGQPGQGRQRQSGPRRRGRQV